MEELVARHGAQVLIHEGELNITGASAEAYFEADVQHHPMSIAGRAVLERARADREAVRLTRR